MSDEDQREFLLRSLEDLEHEHDAGDLDDADYMALKDEYTARAGAVLRAERSPAPSPRRRGNRLVVALVGLVAFAALAGVLVAQSSGRRDSGDSATGSVDQSITETLNEALRCFNEGDAACAIDRYDEVLEQQPNNVEALTYKGWATYLLLEEREDALSLFLDAATIDRTYPDVHAFLAVLFARSGLWQQADRELDRLDALNPPPDVLAQVEGVRQEVDAALAAIAAASTTTTTTTAG